MRRFFLIYILLIQGFYLLANDYDFSLLHGLIDKNGDIHFEISGYSIFCSSMQGKLNDSKTLDKFKKQFNFKDIQANYTDRNIELPNQIIEVEQALEKNPAIKCSQVFYLFPMSNDEIEFIELSTLNQRDILLEKEFINAYLDGSVNDYIFDDWSAETISFLGRIVNLSADCKWIGPHNIYGMGGEINWSEFLSAESAEFDLDTQIAANSEGNFTVLSQNDIDILFEDIPTVAYRVVYLGKNAYKPLIVYYVAQEVNGIFVSCLMSHYGNNRNDYALPPLLKQFMSITSIPAPDVDIIDIPQKENNKNYYDPFNDDLFLNYELRVGSVFPLRDFNRIFQFAPSFDFFMCVQFNQRMSIDFGMMLSFPTGRNPFNFTYQGEKMETKATSLIGASLRYRYNHTLKKDLSCYTYFGAGIFSLSTNLIKEYNNNKEIYHSVEALDLYGGIQLNFKMIGYFIEYHQTPFSNSSKVASDFGKNFLNTGFAYYF